MIRPATTADASRIAEILIFSKRTNYREIFHNDKVSFGEMQVYPLAKNYIDHPDTLTGIWVCDDEFVKGMVHIEGEEIKELYVDPFFAGQGIGSELIEFAVQQKNCSYLWVLEKNVRAIRFYQRHGFSLTDEKQLQEGTPEFIVKMKRLSRIETGGSHACAN